MKRSVVFTTTGLFLFVRYALACRCLRKMHVANHIDKLKHIGQFQIDYADSNEIRRDVSC